MKPTLFATFLLAGSLLAGHADAQKSADTLRIAWRDAIPNVDPYYNQLRTGLVLAHHVWDTLVYNDPETLQIRPLLATSWRMPDDHTIDFTLRPGVTFHNGDALTADDVVYTINTVLTDPQVAVPSNYAYLVGAEKLDTLVVRVKLRQAFPAALAYLAMTLPIWPKQYRETVGREAFAKAPVGTGPYRITRLDGMSRIDLERNDSYFGGPKGRPAIGRLAIHEVADDAAEMAELKQGRADWIWDVSADQFASLGATPGLQAVRSESMRLAYLTMDAAGRTGSGNPLTQKKVRQAIAVAIDRRSIARNLVQGGSRVLDAPCYPTQFGCDQASAAHVEYDPARARALLSEAGFPSGFATELVTYTVPQWADAVQVYLKAVGIDLRVTQMPLAAAMARSAAGTAPMFLGTWGSYSINDVSAILPFFFDGGAYDTTRDPAVTDFITRAGAVSDPDQRRHLYGQAIQLITSDAGWLPMFTTVSVYGISRELSFKAYPDELPRFYLARWN